MCNNAARVHLNSVQAGRVCQMLQDGRTQRDAAVAFGVSQTCIWNICNRFQDTGSFTRRPGSGRTRVTDVCDDRYINLLTRRNPFYSAPSVLREVRQARCINVGVQTIRNRLHDSGLRARRPNVVPVLTQRHRQDRLQWAREHRGWTLNQWSRVLFLDESRFTVDHNHGRIRVWRRRGERFHPQFAVAHSRWGAGSVMIWAGISSEYRTGLHVVQGNVNGQCYLDSMATPIVVPLATRQNHNFLFMDHNAPAHRARLVQNALIQNNVVRMEWPALSPDLNPIENLWSIPGRRNHSRDNLVTTVQELTDALIQEWQALDQTVIRNTIRTMRRRCIECISNRGAPTSF